MAYLAGLTVSITVSETMLVALTVVLAAECWWRRSPPRDWPLAIPMLVFVAATLLAAAASGRPLDSLVSAKSLLTLGAFYVMVLALPGAAAAHRAFRVLAVAVGVVAAVSILQVSLCPAAPPAVPILGRFFRKCGRAHGFYGIYMTLAGVLSLVLLTAAPQMPSWARRAPWRLAAWLASAVALAYTQVRGAWVGIAAGVLTGAALGRRAFIVPVVGLVAALVVAMAASPVIRDRAVSLLRADLDAFEEALEQAGAAPSVVKVQAAGPWTLVAAIELRTGHRVLTDDGAVREFTASLAEGLALHAAEVARRTGARVVVQLDEPSLPAVLTGRLSTPSGLGTVSAVPAADAQ